MSDTEVMTTNDVADELGTDAKTLRKFFRSDKCDIEPVGQGKRYAITPDDIEDLKIAFSAWSGGKAKKADADDAEPKPDKAPAKGKARKSKKAAPAPVAEEDEDLGLDDDEEPTADALSELEDLELDDADLEV